MPLHMRVMSLLRVMGKFLKVFWHLIHIICVTNNKVKAGIEWRRHSRRLIRFNSIQSFYLHHAWLKNGIFQIWTELDDANRMEKCANKPLVEVQ